MLGAEETNASTEALRLAAYAKYKPLYYWDTVQKLQISGTEWRLLISADVDDMDESHFLGVIEKWTLAAEMVIPPIKETEIVSTSTSTETSSNLGTEIKRVSRKLVPKRKDKDSVLNEEVVVSRHGASVYAEFIPQVHHPTELPFYYPKVYSYAFGYLVSEEDDSCDSRKIAILVRELTVGSAMSTKTQQVIWQDMIKRLYKWMVTERIGYQKHMTGDVVVNYEQYKAKYDELKQKYALQWVNNWPEKTDPQKFVYEDIAIASWLICLWKQDEAHNSKPPTFVDLGCGNGLLVYLLNSEGYHGYGIDQSARSIWTKYGSQVDLRAQTLEPYNFTTSADWIIGNHADELVPWIPIIAAQSGTTDSKFVVIPCCPHGLSGKKIDLKTAAGESRYYAYLAYITELAEQCGFELEREFLRIPSTKNVAIVGRRRTSDARQVDIAKLMELGKQGFAPRIPDAARIKTHLAKARQRNRNNHKSND
ncbi:tRNA(Ser) Um(44) 2'-O-methyltransferase [Coemansia guatemalensis]|uniref:tRNA (uracil-O(2)-)-methyltransferase n=1 Tax=Coemansia guatemalensis TaxID=2761395 RepID=A0A9W8LRG2_9FUNG|nr:tRNA(Ser) Um(44) 2'-O-methyltransferase [Coemansia guatemalensis]